jgi:hypothetical protein
LHLAICNYDHKSAISIKPAVPGRVVAAVLLFPSCIGGLFLMEMISREPVREFFLPESKARLASLRKSVPQSQ